MSLIFYSFLLIWTSQLFNSERVLLWIIKIIIEAGKKSQENTTYKKGQAYTKETLQVMIHFIEGIFFFCKKLCHKNTLCSERSKTGFDLWQTFQDGTKFRKSCFPQGEWRAVSSSFQP